MMKVNVILLALVLGLLGLPNVTFGQGPGLGDPDCPVVFDWVINNGGVANPPVSQLCRPSPALNGCSPWTSDGETLPMPLSLAQACITANATCYLPFYLVLDNGTPLVIKVVTVAVGCVWEFHLDGNPQGYTFEEEKENYFKILGNRGNVVTEIGFLPDVNNYNSSLIHIKHLACNYHVYTMMPCLDSAPPTLGSLRVSQVGKNELQGNIAQRINFTKTTNPTPTNSWTAVNPLSDNLVLTFDVPLPAATLVQVYNMNGGLVHREVVTADATQVSLAAAHWTPGMYAVSVNHAGGSQQKLVVKQ